MKSIKFTIDSDLQQVSLVCICVSSLCTKNGIDDITSYHVELCADEALNNVIIHAYGGVSGKKVQLGWALDENLLTMEIEDNGSCMELPSGQYAQALSPPDVPGGRGRWLIHNLMDEVHYESGNEVNRLRLIKRIGF